MGQHGEGIAECEKAVEKGAFYFIEMQPMQTEGS
jgi:hypothetical protein